MSIPLTGIDHFTIRVTNLDFSQDLFKKLGFTLAPRGYHESRGTSNHIAPLAGGNYFELIHIPPGVDSFRSVARAQGPLAIALAPLDSQIVYSELMALGHSCEPPREFSRPVNLPGSIQTARFLNVMLPPIEPRSVDFFTCQHLTRDLLWRPEWENHLNGAERITNLIIVCPSPKRLQASYEKVFGEFALSIDDQNLTVSVGPDTISVLTPATFKKRFPTVLLPTDIGYGQLVGATFKVRCLATVERILFEAGVSTVQTPARSVIVEPTQAVDTLVEFSEMS
ncbi:VOC family protein [Rhizobium rhizogenes]|uniref:VOC family protein n=1 Tax=Rhizobium rhizogenes TaxID=359 RepID=UPI001574BF8C|nr:VOC family protein [Rhizobium rhizogenes]NTI24872.1 VOC family protein [Rhizobium rhizogenes]QTG08592.1 VOC family protein [Rhizobium rhizogenes]